MAGINRVLFAALVACALVVVGVVMVGADEGVMLGYAFAEGHSRDYKVKFNQEVDFGGFAMSQIVDMEVTEKCTGKEGELFLMELAFNKVESTRIQFDNMVDDPTGERLTGHAVSFKVDTHGEATDIRPVGFIEGWEQMAKIVESVAENWFAYLPNENVAEGKGWSENTEPEQDGGMTVTAKADYVFKEKKNEKGCECAKVEAKTENTLTGTQDTPAGTMVVDGGGKGNVEFYFCMTNSSIVKYKAKIEMKMDMTPEGGGDATETSVGITMEREAQ